MSSAMYSFDLASASKANPAIVQLIWSPSAGIHYKLVEDIDFVDWMCEIKEDRLLMKIEEVDNHRLVWDLADLDSIWNYLIESKNLPNDVRQKMTTGSFGDLTGADFDNIPHELKRKAVADFKSHSYELNPDTILDILEYSYLIVWIRAQVKAGNVEKV